MKNPILYFFLILLISMMACTITLPIDDITTREPETMEISQELNPEDAPIPVTIKMGAGDLSISHTPGDGITGTITYNITQWKPTLQVEDNSVTIDQSSEITSVLPVGEIINRWQLGFGDVPIDLTLNAGAYNGVLDLSNIPLVNLRVNDGASNSEIFFNSQNPEEMDRLVYKTGASNVSIRGLSNANFSEMNFIGGAGSYLLDFGGELQRDAEATIDCGVGSMQIIIPDNIPVRVKFTGELSNVDVTGTWTVRDGVYLTEGDGPLLDMVVDISLGSLELVRLE